MSIVIDASAVLAILFGEHGGDVAFPDERGAALCAVNYAEVIDVFARRTGDSSAVPGLLRQLELVVMPFDADHARIAADLKPGVGKNDSMADRACLALAIATGSAVVTADSRWADLKLGIDIRLIR